MVASGRGQLGDARCRPARWSGWRRCWPAPRRPGAAAAEALELVVVAADEVRELIAEYPLAAQAAARHLAAATGRGPA
ncbi:MAG: hypothetical protein R3B06_31620 [Kofleriaceae bacterium]